MTLIERAKEAQEHAGTGPLGRRAAEEWFAINGTDLAHALIAAGELAHAQEKYHEAVTAYEEMPTDRGGVYGPKGTQRTLMLTKYALMQHALAAYRAALQKDTPNE